MKPGQRLLDIGCGWGGLSHYAAEHHGVQVVGITVSEEQQRLARQRCAGLPVEIRLMDYRDLTKQPAARFDRIVSVGMFEHVGAKNYRAFAGTAWNLLHEEGLFLLHTIGRHQTAPTTDPWIDKYIFPNGKIPSAPEIARAIEGLFIIEDWHNFGPDYDRTLMAWWHKLDAAWPGLPKRYDRQLHRRFKYYLLSCAAFFRARQGQLWQLMLTKRSYPHTYRPVRL